VPYNGTFTDSSDSETNLFGEDQFANKKKEQKKMVKKSKNVKARSHQPKLMIMNVSGKNSLITILQTAITQS